MRDQIPFFGCGTVVDAGEEGDEGRIGCTQRVVCRGVQALTPIALTLQHKVFRPLQRHLGRISPWAGEDFRSQTNARLDQLDRRLHQEQLDRCADRAAVAGEMAELKETVNEGESERSSFKFKITNFPDKMADARAGRNRRLLIQKSKYRLEVHLDGTQLGRNNYMSVRLMVMDGEWDDTEEDIILRLVDQYGGVKNIDTLLTPGVTHKVWERFVSQQEVTKHDSLYVKNDTLVFQVIKVKNRVGTNLIAAGAEGIKPHQM